MLLLLELEEPPHPPPALLPVLCAEATGATTTSAANTKTICMTKATLGVSTLVLIRLPRGALRLSGAMLADARP